MSHKSYVYFLMLMLAATIAGAQPYIADSSVFKKLPEITVTADRFLKFSSGNNIRKIDTNILSEKLSSSIADILQQQSIVTIKSYGGGSLANASVRGAGPEHTAILWNGFNLQSSMNGQSDLALLPALFADEIFIQLGGPGAIWGNGIVGGAVVLNNVSKFNEGFKIRLSSSAGSFHSLQQSTLLKYSGPRFITSTKFFHNSSLNDIKYMNYAKPGSPFEFQTHAEVIRYGILQENYFLINQKQQAGVRFWYQFNDREIPPSLFQAGSEARQKDRNLRVSADWQRTGKKTVFMIRSAYFNDYIMYNDNLSSLNAESMADTWISETEMRLVLRYNQTINVGLNNTFQQAKVDDYIFNPERERIAIFASYKISDKRQIIQGTLSARQEFTKGIRIPFIPSAGIETRFLKIFRLTVEITRNFRLPTFNEMYWNPGGNHDLKPEKGWSEDISLTMKTGNPDFSISAGLSFYNRNMVDWVVWLPKSNYWTPNNLQEVWSRGLEWSFSASKANNGLRFVLNASGNYTLTTSEKSKKPDDASVGKQLMYIPKVNIFCNASIFYKGIYFNYNHIYTGYRFTSSDNSSFLDPYQTGNIIFSGTVQAANLIIHPGIEFYNIWGSVYEIIPAHPMPGRYFWIRLTLEFNKSLNK